jgi:hypothetical protein
MEKVYNNILSSEDIDYLTRHEEVLSAKSKLDTLDVVTFSIELTDSIQKVIQKQFGLTISSVPMRWIKGDTPEHTDTSSLDFKYTYLIYLTDSIGEFVLDNTSYKIVKNIALKFNEGITHKTINTGNIPRLLLGPMNEFGITVGFEYNLRYYDTDKTTFLIGSIYYTIGTGIINEYLKGYTHWKIQHTNNSNITDYNIVYPNNYLFEGVSEYFYDLYAYVPPPSPPSPPPPPPPTHSQPLPSFSMRSLFTNNAEVYYKSHSLAPGGIGGVKNVRIKSRKT